MFNYKKSGLMKRNISLLSIIIIGMSLASYSLRAQKILTLKECYNQAATANALAGEKNSYSDISRLKDENLVKKLATNP